MNEQRVFPGFALIRDNDDPPRDPVRWEGCESRDYGDTPVVLLPVSGTPGKDLRVGPFEEWMWRYTLSPDPNVMPAGMEKTQLQASSAIAAALEEVLKGARI